MVRSHEGRLLSLLLAGALLCSAIAPAVALGASPAGDERAGAGAADGAVSAVAPAAVGSPLALQGFEADRTAFEITVYENGSAEWRFRYEKSLNESEREDFEAFADEFNENETELFTNFRKRARWLTDNGSDATGRQMSAENFQRDARTEGLDPQSQALGVVEMSFRWEGFARTGSDGTVEAGDVFEGGLYIGPNQELVFRAGPNLTFVAAEPADGRVTSASTLAESETVTWTGERSFTPQKPRAVLSNETDAGGTEAPVGTDGTPTQPGGGDESGSNLLLTVGALLVVLVVGAVAVVAYRSGSLPPGGGGEAGAGAGGGGAGAAGGAAGGDAAQEAADPVGVTEEELLSDEERVINLLEDNGGRMKQVDIVDETEWSKSKVSMLLSDMEDDEEISKLRVGRENIVSLTGHEPDAAGSPFDDED